EEADSLCDRLAIIDRGTVAALGPPGKLKRDLGGDIVRLRPVNFNPDGLRGLEYIKKVDQTDGEVELTVRNANEHLQEILERVGKVKSVEVRPLTLEDVFIHYTGRAIREGGAEGGWAEKAMHSGAGR
ncbi:MAG TPA: DUF4162 domain-containing protein, partial [Methanomicrobiales archaeon]|nr:DUF4162 domain-containing protein [Methanomicrobiales archaeon]